MAWSVAERTDANDVRQSRARLSIPRASEATLAPIFAGAYARGVADMLDGLGLPALFLRRDGRVLFCSAPAQACLGGGLRLEVDHIVADGAEDSRRLDRLISDVICSRRPCNAEVGASNSAPLTLHCLPFGSEATSVAQIADVMLLLDAGADPVLSSIIERMTAMRERSGRPLLDRNKDIDAPAMPEYDSATFDGL